ncbi:MAG: sigma 54-interacting transcriptional regulator [Myxococcota bacterium]|nr:sigma 54-interacting transcriptional regulator [Myxococcota bacterium]
MALMEAGERRILEAIDTLTNGNPFLTERVEAEHSALGDAFVRTGAAVWHVDEDLNGLNPNVPRLGELVEKLGTTLRDRLAAGRRASERELGLYLSLVNYLLYQRYENEWLKLILAGAQGRSTTGRVAAYAGFERDVSGFLDVPDLMLPRRPSTSHLFAIGYQIRRAFHHTFRQIYGGSMPAARLRATVWESIFTCDVHRYRRTLYAQMSDVPTLIVGESGTGKELVARAVALSSYIPFDPESRAFAADYTACFQALNLSALSPTLIESELFGHRRGAFTGALQDRRGWLETCPPEGTVFLDEVGELDGGIQVKLLRVLQTRAFQRIGETADRRFPGKIVAATNRDLAEEMRERRFRSDFYYRLCADLVRTPTLREQLDDAPDELHQLTLVLSRRIVGHTEADRLADEVTHFVEKALGPRYPWPGNVRELEQCVRSVLVRGRYHPPDLAPRGDDGELGRGFRDGSWSAEELLQRYCTHVYARVGSYEETARRLGIDRRTVKARIDPELLARLTDERS